MRFRDFILRMRTACRLEVGSLDQDCPAARIFHGSQDDDPPVEELARRMLALPDSYLHILLLRFGCGMSFREIDDALDIDRAAGAAGFALHLLACGLHLQAPPSAGALRKAADQLLENFAGAEKMLPSKGCNRKMRAILNGAAPPTRVKRLPLRTLAAAAIIAALLVALAAAAVAAVIRNTFSWSITPTEDGVVIAADDILREPTTADYEEMRPYRPARLPDGFAYAYTDDHENHYLTDYYHSEEGQRIILWKALAGPGVTFGIMKDELDSFERLEIDGATYLYYEHSRHGRGVVYWELDGFAFMLVTPFEQDQALEIARSVSR